MQSHFVKMNLKTVFCITLVLLLGAGTVLAQQQINLSAVGTALTLPDGSSVPMWGYSCGALVPLSTATCAKLNTNPLNTGWSPVIITVPTGQSLQITLTNGLTFAGGNIPTSLTIVGQLGGGLGTTANLVASPTHATQGVTWFAAGDTSGPTFNPPVQGKRVQSFTTESLVGTPATYTWSSLNPGTYLIESGTHPSIQGPMGLYGILVVTTAPASDGTAAGTAYPGVNYAADVPLLLSEIDPTQNNSVNSAVLTPNFSETSAYVARDSVSSVTVNLDNAGNPIGGSGYVVGDVVTIAGGGYTTQATAQVSAVDGSGAITAVTVTNPGQGYTSVPSLVTVASALGTGAMLTANLSLSAGTTCSDGAGACYPPAVNYTPLYYLINGQAFDKTTATNSLFAATPGSAASPISGTILVRLVNAGLRMHVPSIVGAQTGSSTAPLSGFSLIAEDGNVPPGAPRVQSEVFMAAGKTYDVMINVPAAGGTALPIFDRELSLSGHSINRDSGMLAYIGVNGSLVPVSAALAAAKANPDTYKVVCPSPGTCNTLKISDSGKGLIANDFNVYGVRVPGAAGPQKGVLDLNLDGTFTYTPNHGWATSDTFTYCGNGATSGAACASVTLTACTAVSGCLEGAGGITKSDNAYTANTATYLAIKPPGVLTGFVDAAGYPLTVDAATVHVPSGSPMSVATDANGAFTATVPAAGGPYTFTFQAKNSQGTHSATANVSVTFPAGNGPTVTVLDGADHKTQITDYRWVIEEDRTFYVDPNCTTNPLPAGCPTINGASSGGTPPVFGTNFHTSSMPLVATGCTGPLSCESGQTVLGNPTVCDIGNGVCRMDGSASQETAVDPSQVRLDPTKRYYISVLPGDAANPFNAGYGGAPDCSTAGVAAGSCGHGMGGAPIAKGQTAVTVMTVPSPYPPAKLTVFVFEDDFPLNGEHDAGGGIDVLSPNEPGLGGFQITLFDDAGGTGDATGQPTYDMFNMPLTNSLAGSIDPSTGLDACPVSTQDTANAQLPGPAATPDQCSVDPTLKGCQKGIVGMIVTCPKYESDGTTLSPLAGQAVVNNLYQGRYGVVATPNADRIARGEEWLQTNTLDGQKAHDSFMRIGEPGYFQEFGPAGYHVSVGFANPKIINDRLPSGGTNEVKGHVTTARMSRTPDERLYGSGTHDAYSFTQCYAAMGDPDGAAFAFVKCDADGNFDFTSIPAGNWKLTIFDQWNDQVVDGISTPVGLAGAAANTLVDLGEIAAHQWQANIYTRSFIDTNGDGVSTKDTKGVPCTAPNTPLGCNANYGNDTEPGLTLVATNIRFRDGSFSNFNNTDLNGYAGFNEVFPLFNWYTIETDSTRFKTTGVHVVYDAGGPTDGTAACGPGNGNRPCGNSTIGQNFANTYELNPLPADLSVPGAVYCDNADCNGFSIAGGPVPSSTTNYSTGRIDPPFWFGSYGWQGFSGQNSFLEFGKKPFAAGETGGIRGHVIYASTRPFDDPQLLLQLSWEPMVPHVRVNLYKEGVAADGTQSLTLVDHTETSSFDDWAQGFRSDGKPNMNCPGQSATDVFFYGLQDQPNYLDWYNSLHASPAATATPLPYNSQYKCYDGMHNWNQLQPAPYDGMYNFPSVTSLDPITGKPTGASVTISSISEAAAPSTTVTVTTSAAHNFSSGSIVLIAGVTPSGFDGGFVATVTGPTTFTYSVASSGLGTGVVTATSTATAGATNCTACIPNPDSTDPYRSGAPMLPAGKYVVEVVVPPGYELVKEEDKNILIGDNYIAPVTQQFAGLGNIFILPDQAEITNANNPQNSTTSLGRASNLPSHEGDTGSVETFWPCVGEQRTVPDFISLFPGSAEVSPFAGAIRNLCDRKEVTLEDQSSALAKFYIFTSVHVASHFTGVITDDFTAEFDPFSPQFGEKFAPAYLPVSIKDWSGNEVSRVYADEFGAYNGLNYSTWEVDPPNPTGYGPTMMVSCMNDRGTGATPDPLYQPGYSQFCYELPFMPGQTGYFDTPVVPTSAFAGAGYNNPDCSYPDATPAIASVTGSDGVAGPWLNATGTGHTLTITALGDQVVPNNAYSGPAASGGPFNQKSVTRHYGFGATAGTVTVGGVALTNVSWSDTTITGDVPAGVPACSIQQQAQYAPGATQTYCGQLLITAANGKQSVDSVTVTIGGKQPSVVTTTIQAAIDAASPGDMIIVPQGIYNEFVLMWKPVRLQGVGAASTIINANTHPAGKLEAWRQQVVCLFGLTLDGRPSTAPYDGCPAKGESNFSGGPNFPTMVVDRVPMEGILGWDTTVNGNLAEQLIEPSLLGAYEGAAITVLGKGVNIPANAPDAWGSGAESAFPDGSVLLTAKDCTDASGKNLYPSNFYCNPSSIDGLSLTNSSQGGGGILVHGWAHNIQIANNRVHNNQGTLSGGITVGQGEHVDQPLGGASTLNIPPGSCETSNITNQALPFCYNMNVNVHNNAVTLNSSLGDELFSSTPAGAGGVSFCNGSDYYRFNYNWVCGNLSTGDGGGVAHIGWSKNGDIEHNSILFNQSTNPTIATNGGGLLIMGAPDADPPCATTDQDCVSPPNTITPSDGTGLGLVVNANLILGNSADSGSGGGLRLQHVNGTDVINFPDGANACKDPTNGACLWNSVNVTNNIIANNVAGWDGGGVSLQDALAVNVVNNTIVSNDSTASSGVLFQSLFAPLASTPGTNCTVNNGSQSCPQVAGLVSVTNSDVLVANLPSSGITCPPNHGISGSCAQYSAPLLANNVIWQNRSFFIGVGDFGTGGTSQQKVITLYNSFTTTPAPSQPTADATTANGNGTIITGGTGACVAASYWEIGVRGDKGPNDHTGSGGSMLAPTYSVLTDASDYPGGNNLGSDPTLVSQYCNGSRVPPEFATSPFLVIPGTNEVNALPTPVFSLAPAATVDEGNNWVNIIWGPISLTHPMTGVALGNYAPAKGSPVIDAVPDSSPTFAVAPPTDFFGNPRPDPTVPNAVDIGAVEVQIPVGLAPNALNFGNVLVNTTSAAQTVSLINNSGAALTGITITGPTGMFAQSATTCGSSLATGTSCTISITFHPTARGVQNGTVTVNSSYGSLSSNLTGFGVAPNASVSPTTLTFPGTTIGSTSATQPVTLSNIGDAPLTVSSITFTGANPSDYLQTNNCGGSVAAGGHCTITVSFRPTGANARTATLSIADNSLENPSPQTVTLNGTGNGPVLSVSPVSLTFNSPLNVTSAPQTVTVQNTGNQNLRLTSVTFTGGQFGQTNNCSFGAPGMAPNASCTITVTFTPTTASTPKTAVLHVNANAPAVSQSVNLTGNVTAPVVTPTVSPASGSTLAFGNQLVGTTSAGQTITVTNSNTSTANLVISSITLGGTNANQFVRTGCTTGGSGLTPGGSCNISVTFRPTSTGAKSATITVNFASPASPNSATFTLTGTGTQATVQFSAPFPAMNGGGLSTKDATVTVTNNGTAPLTLTADPTVAKFSGTGTGAASVQPGGSCVNGAVVAAAGGTCTINVRWVPTNTATANLRVTLTDSGAATGSQNSATFPAN